MGGGGRQQAGANARHATVVTTLGTRGPLPVNLKGGLVYFQEGGGSIRCALDFCLLKSRQWRPGGELLRERGGGSFGDPGC